MPNMSTRLSFRTALLERPAFVAGRLTYWAALASYLSLLRAAVGSRSVARLRGARA